MPHSETFRNSEAGECVWYVKDWSFAELEPRWGEDLMGALPNRLRPRNEMDLLSGLQGKAAVDVLMAYVGGAETRTPLHLDKAASIAFNCLTWSESEDACKKWWMFHPEDRIALDQFIQNKTQKQGHLAEDSHWLNPNEFGDIRGLRKPVYCFEQRVGDLVIVPPNAAHCVLNRGGLSFAVAANIIDATMATEALDTEDRNQRLCVASVYKVSCAIWGSLRRFSREKKPVPESIAEACMTILKREEAGQLAARAAKVQESDEQHREKALSFFSMVICDHCRTDIFNGYLSQTAKTTDKTFCLRKECMEVAFSFVGGAQRLYLMMPHTLEELQAELQSAIGGEPVAKKTRSKRRK